MSIGSVYSLLPSTHLSSPAANSLSASVSSVVFGPSWTVMDVPPKSDANSSTIRDPDFGELKARQTVFHQRVGRYIVARPITIFTYWNAGGYTSVIHDFEALYGYGDSVRASVDDSLIHLEQDRDFYGNILEGTKTALELRDRLQSYLVPCFK